MSEPTVLEACDLTAGYRGVPAVRELNLSLRAGELVCLLGANGAGKSTTLLTLAGHLRAIAGDVRWRGQQTTAPADRRARLGLAFIAEERSVFTALTVAQNLRLGLGDPARAVELFPELSGHLHRRAGLLSGGQQQLLALGRALAGAPVVLLADELSLGLAPIVTRRLLEAVRRAVDTGAAALIVEQRARQALKYADRACVLQRGRMVLEGPAPELRRDLAEIERAYFSSAGPRLPRVVDFGRPDRDHTG